MTHNNIRVYLCEEIVSFTRFIGFLLQISFQLILQLSVMIFDHHNEFLMYEIYLLCNNFVHSPITINVRWPAR